MTWTLGSPIQQQRAQFVEILRQKGVITTAGQVLVGDIYDAIDRYLQHQNPEGAKVIMATINELITEKGISKV